MEGIRAGAGRVGGVMAKTGYSDELKAAAMAALLTGQSVSSVAKEYKIPKGTVSSWKDKAHELANRGGVESDSTQKKEIAIGELITIYLETNLDTLRKQAAFFSDERWLSRQSASELAVLHGVLADKAIRILEAAEAGQDAENQNI